MVAYFSRPVMWLKVIKYIIYLGESKPEVYKRLKTFPGFVGIFCDTVCAWKQEGCNDVAQKAKCYSGFVRQKGLVLNRGDITRICKAWDKKDPDEIGKQTRIPENFVTPMSKKRSKNLGKNLNRIHKRLRHEKYQLEMARACGYTTREVNGIMICEPKKTKKTMSKKEVSTTFFHNDDKEWEATIDGYLTDDSNDRKQAKTNKHSA
jgi:hypothetical protein